MKMNTKHSATLYQYEVCPFCHKVRAILEYKKVPYRKIEVHPMNKKEIAFSPDYRKVPIWVEQDGTQVNDSNAIMRHLDTNYKQRPVFETDAQAQPREKEWMDWSNEKLVRALPPLIYRNYSQALKSFNYITQQGNFNWFQQRLVKFMGAGVMTLVARKSAKSQGIEDPEAHLQTLLNTLGSFVKDKNFIGESKPNGADLSIFGVLKSIQRLSAFDFVRKQTAVFNWYQRVEQAIQE